MIALFPGSFDPPHRGHLDLVRRAAAICDRLVVGVAHNPRKTSFLPIERRLALLRGELGDLGNVTVLANPGQTAAFAREHGATVLIRGVRGAPDVEFERGMAGVHRQAVGLETLLLIADPAVSHLSSTLVREAARAGLPLDALLTPVVAAAVREAMAAAAG